jgi:hypothetical protein
VVFSYTVPVEAAVTTIAQKDFFVIPRITAHNTSLQGSRGACTTSRCSLLCTIGFLNHTYNPGTASHPWGPWLVVAVRNAGETHSMSSAVSFMHQPANSSVNTLWFRIVSSLPAETLQMIMPARKHSPVDANLSMGMATLACPSP